METYIEFLIKASAGIVLFYLVFWVFLKNETYHSANRLYLLAALVSSVLLPLFPSHYTVIVEQGRQTNFFTIIPDTFQHLPVIDGEEKITGTFAWQQAVLLVYFTGAAIFLLRLFTQTFILIHLIIKHRTKTREGIRIVENEKYGLPFSFFNVVFINPKFHKQENLPEILAHEKVHIRENHWFDLIIAELLTVIFWFNPFIWFFERSIKQNHEYMADRGVLAQGHHVGRYQALLINQLMGMQIIGVTNNLNFALNTKRLEMMTKTKTSRWLGIKFMWSLPALALLLAAFAEPDFKTKPMEPANLAINVRKGEKEFVIKGQVVRGDNGKPLAGASVILSGTTIGTVTSPDGKFSLTDPDPESETGGGVSSEVVVSYVGFSTLKMKVAATGEALEDGYTFKMQESVIVLDMKELIKKLPVPPPPVSNKANQETAKGETPPPPPPVISDAEEDVYYVVEELPEYPKGMGFLANDILQKEKLMARENNVKGKAKIGFTVSETGEVTDVKIIEAENETAGKAAASIVSEMPLWTPAKQHGKAVPVKFMLPLEF